MKVMTAFKPFTDLEECVCVWWPKNMQDSARATQEYLEYKQL